MRVKPRAAAVFKIKDDLMKILKPETQAEILSLSANKLSFKGNKRNEQEIILL